jgi:hypothetical protein
MNFKKFILSVIFAANFFLSIYAEEGTDAIISHKIKQKFQYYGFPLVYTLGYEYRNNDFVSYAPFAGVIFDARQDSDLQAVTGMQFRYNRFYVKPQFFYEIWNPAVKSFSQETEYGVQMTFGAALDNGGIDFISQYGKNRWTCSDETVQNMGTFKEIIQYDCFIVDNLIFKATGTAQFALNLIPEKSFSSYNTLLNIPFTYNWYYGETCFLYSLFYTDYLDLYNNKNKYYDIYKKYSFINGRSPLKADTNIFAFLTAIELEQRFYVFRFFGTVNNFYVSAFANLAAGFNKENSIKILYQYGIGAGYNLYGCVPFTFQIGVDNNNSLIFYFGIVSKITHRP